jgi:hypothetical protein
MWTELYTLWQLYKCLKIFSLIFLFIPWKLDLRGRKCHSTQQCHQRCKSEKSCKQSSVNRIFLRQSTQVKSWWYYYCTLYGGLCVNCMYVCIFCGFHKTEASIVFFSWLLNRVPQESGSLHGWHCTHNRPMCMYSLVLHKGLENRAPNW